MYTFDIFTYKYIIMRNIFVQYINFFHTSPLINSIYIITYFRLNNI